MARVAPGEIFELERTGTVSESLKPYAALAIEEADGIAFALGGVDNISEQRLALIQDATRVGIVMRSLLALFLQAEGNPDPEIASKIGTLASTRRSLLSALGLDRVAKDVPNLSAYLEHHERTEASQVHADRSNDNAPDPQAEDEGQPS